MSNPLKYTIGWICAITAEIAAAPACLREQHNVFKKLAENDNNNHAAGDLYGHNVVIATLPRSEYGTSTAATVARNMLVSFPDVRIVLMVGVGGGAPSRKHDIRLGDTVVSCREGTNNGVLQYDHGRAIQSHEFVETGSLNKPPQLLLTALSALEALMKCAKNIAGRTKTTGRYWPPPTADRLYSSFIPHPQNLPHACSRVCGDDPVRLMFRPERGPNENNPAIHYRLIASANTLMRDAYVRNKFAAEQDTLCFEVEAAGLMNHFPCLMVRGICDYADTHQIENWQAFAALIATAFVADLLQQVSPKRVEAERRVADIVSGL